MNWLQGAWDAVATHMPAIVAGAMGGVVRWLHLKEGWRDGITSIIAGAICSVYFGPAGMAFVDPIFERIVKEPVARERLGGFLMGILGIMAVGFIIEMAKAIGAKWSRKR